MKQGSEYVSNEELLAIILGTGTNNVSVKNLATEILKQFKNVQNLKDANYEQLKRIKGIGDAKACSLLATIELGKRINQKVSNIKDIKMPNVLSVFYYFRYLIGNKKQEHFYCLYLDNKNKVIKEKLLFIGTINYSMIHPREIFKEAYLAGATSIICVHNHPSGNITPSENDKNITKKLIEAGNLLGVKLVDHIIISNDNYYSFLENGNI